MINYRVIVLSSKEPDNKFVGWLRPLEGSTNDMELLFYNNLSWKPIGMIYPSKITPLMNGVASIGVSKLYAREDHVHPSDTSKANKEDVYTKEEIIAINDEFIKRFDTIDEAIQSLQSTLSDYQSEVNNLKESKQDKLVSGTNIKTINNESILGAGNISLLTLEEAKKNFIPLTSIGSPNGVASLNESGIIPSDQLPSYVDDVIEVYATYETYEKDAIGNLSNIKLYNDAEHSNIISTGESGKIYINVTEGEPSYNFRWSGTEFLYINTGGVVIGEVTGTAYDGKKGKDTTDKLNTHVLDYNNPHKVTKSQVGLENVDNTSDANKPISTATQEALNDKINRVDICSHGTQTNPESTGSKFYRLINNKAFYIDNATGYVAIEIPAINNPNYIFDVTIIGGSKEIGKLNINARVVSGKVYSIISNQFGLKEVIPVSAGLTQDGSKLAVLLGSSTWTVKTINVDISIGGQNSYDIQDTNATISFITDISSYKSIKTSNINTGDYSTIAGINNIQPYRDDNIFDKDPKSFNLNPGQSINVWGNFPEVGSGLLQIYRVLASSSYKAIFFKYDTNDIYIRKWWDSTTSTGLQLNNWEKIPVIPMNGTSSQFIKGDGSLDNTEYRPVVINNSKTTNAISRRDFLYTVANTNNVKTGTLVIEIPLASSRVYEFEVILGSYRYYHKPTSLFFHLYRDKNANPNSYCVCTKVGSLSYEDIRIAEKTDGQNFCILIGNVDSTWHHEIIRIPELVEDVYYLDSEGLNIEATAYITTDESVFSKIRNINTNSYYDPSSNENYAKIDHTHKTSDITSLNGFSSITGGLAADILDTDDLNHALQKLNITTQRNAPNNIAGCSEYVRVDSSTSQYASRMLYFNRPIISGKYYTVTIGSIDEVVDEGYEAAPGFSGILYDADTAETLSNYGTFTKDKLSIVFTATKSSTKNPCLLLYAGVAGSSEAGRTTTYRDIIVTEGTTPVHQWYPSYDDMVRKTTDRNLLRLFDLEQGEINTTSGTNQESSISVRTKNFVPISSSALYAQAFYGRYYGIDIFYYTADKEFISFKFIMDGTVREKLTVPSNAKYIRFYLTRLVAEYVPDDEGNPTEELVPLTPEYVIADKYNRISISEEGYQNSWFISDLDLIEIIDNKIASAKPNISANLWGNQFTGTEDFSDKSLYIKGSTTGIWAKGLNINRTGDTTTGGAFIGAYGPNTGTPSHLCLGYTYGQASMIINVSSRKVALGVNLTPTNDYYDENVNVIGNLCTTGNNLLKPTFSGNWETGVYVKTSNGNAPLASLKGNNNLLQLVTHGSYITQDLTNNTTTISSNLTVTGDLTTNKASSTEGFFETSDERVKDFKENIEVDLEKLSKLSKKYFSFKRTPDKLNIGVSAQEIKEIYPEIVSESSSGILSVDYSKLSVIALAAIDKLYNRIVEIEKRLNNEY